MAAPPPHVPETSRAPPRRDQPQTTRITGPPPPETHTPTMRHYNYRERPQIYTSVIEWREKVLIHKHVVMRGDTVLCEGLETRAFCIRHPDDPDRIKAIPVPADIKALCS
jgi:4-hydroxybenzoyl-CoA thioesterase